MARTSTSQPQMGLLRGLYRLLVTLMLVHDGVTVLQSADEPPSRPPWQRPSMLQPVFLNTSTLHVVSPAGRPAHLHCKIQHLGDKTVSWVRKSDLHILTVGLFTYTTDKRFLALHSDGTQEWTLKVLAPTLDDSGVYECQVSTEPKISLPFQLHVVVPRARILGNREQHVNSGSDVNLTCHVSHDTSSIYWYHNGRVINYRGQERLHLESSHTFSRLHITGVASSDSGNYTCDPAGTVPVWAVLHVINGEHPAAMQHNAANGTRFDWPLAVMVVLLLLTGRPLLR
ncbi:zwei Ig domain protein zig-8-like [Pollicipes pollicipes]|uniref:zwei Ig domain protein zig-8-like n=1 Tax=Pollicipes pollicipes TaxID=41117 RepID=UPI001884FDCE|nr:zwei Ig domain protein zig-8-like [Pollicipes pollicipes]